MIQLYIKKLLYATTYCLFTKKKICYIIIAMDIAKILACLTDRGFIPYYIDSREETINKILSLIPKNAKVGFSGSMTVEALNIPTILSSNGYTTYHRSIMTTYSKEDLYLLSRDADWLISSSNAVSEDGHIVNIDGKGNRVASMIYGPKNILIIIGINKITLDLEQAIDRAKNIAAPLNAKRLKVGTPCTITGKCMNCHSIERICRATMILTNPTFGKNFHIIIINENLGY